MDIKARINKLEKRGGRLIQITVVLMLVCAILLPPGMPSLFWAVVAMVVIIAMTVLALRSIVRYTTNKIDLLYFDWKEPIIECSEYEYDDEVVWRAEEHRDRLKKAENPYGVKVYEIIFQEGANVTEDWAAFQDRCKTTTAEILSSWHERKRNGNRAAYLKHMRGQKLHDNN